MARPSILGNHPPTEAEVNHALECCKAIPHIREELLAMEQEMSDIKESLGTGLTFRLQSGKKNTCLSC